MFLDHEFAQLDKHSARLRRQEIIVGIMAIVACSLVAMAPMIACWLLVTP